MEEGFDLIFDLIWDCRCEIGESPVWDWRNRRLLFTDVPRARIHALSLTDEGRETWEVPAPVASLGLCRSGRLVVAMARRVAFYDPHDGRVETLTEAFDFPETNRLNDGKVGPDGCFWVGTMNDSQGEKSPDAVLYRVRPDGRVERKAEGFTESNGLAWTPDGKVMFHSRTSEGIIEAWDFDPASGGLSNHRRIASVPRRNGKPDGGACDGEGHYWSAGNEGGACLMRFDLKGKLLERYEFPVPTPTMPCLAENRLYVPSMRQGQSEEALAKHPATGGLFRMRGEVKGGAAHLFADI